MSSDFDEDFDDESSLVYQGSSLLIDYGWYIVGLGLFYLVFKNKINEVLDKWYEKREERNYAAKYHKDPDMARARIEGLEASRRKMQEELNKKSKEAEIARKEFLEKKRLEKLMKNDIGGQRLGGSASSSFKSEYNPLMNDTGGRYKPPKRSCCKKGGGCG